MTSFGFQCIKCGAPPPIGGVMTSINGWWYCPMCWPPTTYAQRTADGLVSLAEFNRLCERVAALEAEEKEKQDAKS